MKHFLKSVLAAFVGLLVFSVVSAVIAVIGLMGMVASFTAGASSSIKDGSVLVLKLDQLSGERSSSSAPRDYLMGNDGSSTGFAETLSAIHKAKKNDKIRGIYIEGAGCGFSIAQDQEIREALQDFKKSGKWIIAYGDGYKTGDYYISSVADKVYLNPSGELLWRGLGGMIPMMKDFYAKFGIKYVPIKCGKYKSATEVYTDTHLSQPAREQEERIFKLQWDEVCNDVSKSRGISVDSLNSYADRLVENEDQRNLVKYKFIDGLLYQDQVRDIMKKQLGLDQDDEIPNVSVDDMKGVGEDSSGDEVAVYYAYGDIVDVEPQQNLINGNTDCIVGNDMIDDINDLAADDDVKAVVLRVNSPGGSSYASEQIWRAVEMLKKKKPVVVSMSDYAASGGYYISSGANYIFADATTETGSIGVFALYPDGSGLLKDKMGLNFETFKTNRNTAEGAGIPLFFGLLPVGIEPLTEEQIRIEQAAADRSYLLFKTRVAQGRRIPLDKVEEIAQGHVYTGSDALKLRLVDELGGLDKAIAKAARLAKLDKYHSVDYPEQKSFIEMMMESRADKDKSYLDEHLRVLLGDCYQPLMTLNRIGCMGHIQARMPYMVIRNK